MPETTEAVTIDKMVAGWNSHDAARLAGCYTADATFEEVPLGTPLHGQTAIQAMLVGLFQAFPDLVMTPGKSVSQGDCLLWEWVITGTHRAEFNGIPATNKPVQLRGVSVCVLRSGKVAENREYWDLATLLKQLGVGG